MNIFSQELRNAPCGIVFNEKDEVLLVQRRFPPLVWGPPAGFPDHGETPPETIEREVLEETGVSCEILAPLGIYEYPEVNARLLTYVCLYLFGSLRCSYESKNVGWFSIDNLPEEISPPKEVFIKAYDLYKISTSI
ncbi:MAG: NUDIX hydrolase [Bacillota bacterium]|nr:NUDIX hydrolase [Bacillota bacterium]